MADQRHVIASAALGGIAVLSTAIWALMGLPELATPASGDIAAAETIELAGNAITIEHWNRDLYPPLRDPPPPEVAAPEPPKLQATLFAIAIRSGRPVATLDFGDDGLRHLHDGDSALGVEVLAIDGEGVRVRYRDHEFQLELDR